MQKRKTSSILLIIMSCCLLTSLLLNVFLVIKILDFNDMNVSKHEAEEEQKKTESELNQQCRNVMHIEIRTDYDENDESGNTWDKKYVAWKKNYECQFWVQQRGVQDHIYSNEYSLDKFEELVDILCREELKPYQPQADENGKIVRTVLPYKVIVSYGGGAVELSVANIEELVDAMKALAEGN